MNKLLFLDFDGVLFDTLKEVYLVNRYVYNKTGFLDEIDTNHYALYSKYKYLVYNIWMFYYYNKLLFNEAIDEEEIPNMFRYALLNRKLEKEKEFCNEFLEARRELVSKNYDFWKNLETPYDFFYGVKRLFDEKQTDMVVVSKKNKQSILERFETYGFNLPSSKVFAREILDNYLTKADFMAEYMDKNSFNQAIFVDDNSNNIQPTKNNPKIQGLLALWGNCEPNSEGYTQKEALELIEKFFG